VDENRLTPSERGFAWGLFWPEWVIRKIIIITRTATEYLIALHTLWRKEQEERDGNDR